MMTMALVLVTATFANAQEIPTPTHTVYCLGCRGTQAPAYRTPTLPMTYMTVPVRVPMQPTGYTQTTRNYPTPLRSLLFGGANASELCTSHAATATLSTTVVPAGSGSRVPRWWVRL